MSKNVDFKLNISGLRELMQSPEMQAALQEAGGAVAAAAGDEYDVRVHVADYVAIANVFPNSKQAAQENYESNTLLHALGSVGLNMSKGGA